MPQIDPKALGLVALIISLVAAGSITAWVWVIVRLADGRPLLPQAKPRPVPWGIGSVLVIVGMMIITNFAVAQGYDIVTSAEPDDERSPWDRMAAQALLNVVWLIAIPLLLRLTSRARLADLGLERARLGRDLGIGVVACLLMMPIVYGVNLLILLILRPRQVHPMFEMVRDEASGLTAVLAVVAAILLAPLTEELFFRGVLQSTLARYRPRWSRPLESPLADPAVDDAAASSLDEAAQDLEPDRGREFVAIALTSLLFAGLHFPQWPAPIPLFLFSLGLGYVYERTGSLVIPIAMHALFNGVSTTIVLILFGSPVAN